MEAWNREELYKEVWDQPLVKVATKYGISDVMLGKVCRTLQIPLPGRGHWIKKEFGKPVEHKLLPKVLDLPVLYRMKKSDTEAPREENPTPPAEPTDAEYLRIKEVEARSIIVNPEARRHPLVAATAKALRQGKPDNKGFLQRQWAQRDEPCLDLRVSANTLSRAIAILNAFVIAIEKEAFPVSVDWGKNGTTARVYGHKVPFSIVEKYRQKVVREVRRTTWTHREMEYEPKGDLEFRVGADQWGGWRCSDGKMQRLEDMLPTMVGALMREGRDRVLRAERAKLEAIEQRKREIVRMELARQIDEEEKKVAVLDGWVTAWVRARQYRDFIAELERKWAEAGHDLTPQGEKGLRVIWMKQQADRLDPLLDSPPSILDRKREARGW